MDEDEKGVYFARIDPSTGVCAGKTVLDKSFGFDGSLSAIDAEGKTLFYAAPPKHGGNNFTLLAFDTTTGEIKSQVKLHPTPDTQGPAGLQWDAASGKILALMPPVGGGWQLVSIDPASGLVGQTTGLSALPSMHGRAGGAEWLLTTGGKSVFNAGLFTEMGTVATMISIDVGCALKAAPQTNCTLGVAPWPADPRKTSAPMDLAVDVGPA